MIYKSWPSIYCLISSLNFQFLLTSPLHPVHRYIINHVIINLMSSLII